MAQPFNEYELLREKARQRALQQGQTVNEAIQRRFAALGGLQSGASIKTQQLAQQQAQQLGEESMSNIDIAEAAERQRREEVAQARGLQERQLGLQEKQFGLQEKGFEFEKQTKLKQLAMAQKELSMNEDIFAFNKQIAQYEMNQPTDIFGQLLGPEFSINKRQGSLQKALAVGSLGLL